jgi:glucosamine-6-phosphate deaminase
MKIDLGATKDEMGRSAARAGATYIRRALETHGEATIIVATGASQFEMLRYLVAEPDIDWSNVTGFHLDEYVGMREAHPASFRRYLRERFVERLPSPIGAFHYINGETDPEAECDRLRSLISRVAVDVAFVGIGENGHLAFNDPPADFETEEPYLVVELDEACRRQQLGEGWFGSLEEVPRRAISMSVRQILKSGAIVCTVPDERKADAVARTLKGPVTPDVPASILQTHSDCVLYLDAHSAIRLEAVTPQA